MTKILVRPNELRKTAEQLIASAKNIADAMQSMDADIRILRGDRFVGNRAKAIQSRYEQKRDALLKARDLILHFTRDLQQAASIFEKADKNSSSPQPSPLPKPKPAPAPAPVPSPTPAPINRDAIKKIQETIHSMNVTGNPRYQAGNGKTWCNIFTMDYCKKMGVPLPEYLDWNNDKRIDDYLDANEAVRWLNGSYDKGGVKTGPDYGWATISSKQAAEYASQGKVVVAGWENPGGIGHMAVVRPESKPGNIQIAQAGARNFENGALSTGFGNRDVTFFVYKP